MKNLDNLVSECFYICDMLNIPYSQSISISWNGRITTKWGYCRKIGEEYQISIAIRLSEDTISDETTKSVILHEILHTCSGCMNHGKLWKSYCKKIRENFGIKIKTVTSAEELNVSNKYIIKCRRCGYKIRYAMRPRNVERNCPVCGSKKLSCFEKTEDGKIKLWKRK